ncbi:hypothetical protein AO242_06420 [Pseudomonas sp. ICMP 561]|nr:hypothetical protein AO242_06420 [Pseudomonas sp. ICMP 561]
MNFSEVPLQAVGARLARESGGAVKRAYRVIVLRGQASLQQLLLFLKALKPDDAKSVGAGLARDKCTADIRYIVSSLIAGKTSSHRGIGGCQ